MLVEEAMTAHTKTVHYKQSLSDARSIFEQEGFHHLPVMGCEGLIGMITHTDLIRVTHNAHLEKSNYEETDFILETTTVEEAMSRDLKTIEPGNNLAEVARIMKTYHIGCVPVIKDGRLLGLITTTDVLNAYIYNEKHHPVLA
jgi:CBS domain-containing membrane protein